MKKVNIADKLSLFAEHWSPKIVGELNGQYVKVVKFLGVFDWHHHEDEDELFWVISGGFDLELRDRTIRLEEGEFLIVPRGVDHRPVAAKECHVVLLEPASTLNTGNVETAKTKRDLDMI